LLKAVCWAAQTTGRFQPFQAVLEPLQNILFYLMEAFIGTLYRRQLIQQMLYSRPQGSGREWRIRHGCFLFLLWFRVFGVYRCFIDIIGPGKIG
jgi:hypothetical protein